VARVVLARRARLDLLELDVPLIDAVEDALGLLERHPRAGHELRGRLRGLRSLRVGSYRVIYQLIDAEQIVRIASIRHRSMAYRTTRADRRAAPAAPPRPGRAGGSASPSCPLRR